MDHETELHLTVHHSDVHAVFGPGAVVGQTSHAGAEVAPAAWTVVLLPLKRLADVLQLAARPAAAVSVFAILGKDASWHQVLAHEGNQHI